MRTWFLAGALALAALTFPSFARAVECAEFSGAAVLSIQQHYCLSGSITVNQTEGAVIQIFNDNIELDCRGFSIINQNTVQSGTAQAISVVHRRNVRIRNCNISGGFGTGIHVYEDLAYVNGTRDIEIIGNRVSGAYWYGIHAYGTGITIRDNQVRGIGGRAGFAMGIRVGGSVVAGEPRHFVVEGNHVNHVESTVNNAYGIYANNADDSVFAGNTIHRVVSSAPNYVGTGIHSAGPGANRISGNTIFGGDYGTDYGIVAAAGSSCYHNHVRGMTTAIATCTTTGGNY